MFIGLPDMYVSWDTQESVRFGFRYQYCKCIVSVYTYIYICIDVYACAYTYIHTYIIQHEVQSVSKDLSLSSQAVLVPAQSDKEGIASVHFPELQARIVTGVPV